MEIPIFNTEDAKQKSIDELFQILQSQREGLNAFQVKERLEKFGPNVMEEKKKSLLLVFARYFWGPIPWMIEIAAILSGILQHWADLYIIAALLLVNGLVSFFEEYQAGNAIAELRKKLAIKGMVKREGKWQEVAARDIVPGDIIHIRLGNIIPADAKLFEGDYLTVDQSALTGESLPVDKKPGDVIYSSSISKQGEMEALVISTGKNTFFGKTAKLVETAKPTSHFQKAVLQIGHFLIYLSLALSAALIAVQLSRGNSFLELLQFVLVLIIASIPVAMPAVLSVTMALGALKLSKMKAIVTRLESIEEMAGMDVLCCDKTGTLTQNSLTLGEPVVFQNKDPDAAILFAALASKEENQDPIDLAVVRGVKKPEEIKNYRQIKFIPFDPVSKKSEAVLKDTQGNVLFAAKGAPQVIAAQCHLDGSLAKEVQKAIGEMSQKGYRTLGVATSHDGKAWEFLGLLPLFDPIREDSKETIERAKEHGISVKMLTGDNISIAKEIASQLALGSNISIANDLLKKKREVSSEEFVKIIEDSDGFAQIFPEHKYDIVKSLQNNHHLVGMTGDGVNDSPALKQAEVGIAVSGATDAARSAASLALLAPGLSVIIDAIDEARRIFERMNSYTIYRITETLRIMFFMIASILAFKFYPVTAIMIILLALLNDIPIMAIVTDNTVVNEKPVRWQMRRILIISSVLSIIGITETFLLLIIAKYWLKLSVEEIQAFIFLKLSLAGHMTLFVARTKNAFFLKPFPSFALFATILGTQALAAMIVGFGWLMTAIPWSYVGLIWAYCLFWIFIEDGVKLLLYKYVNFEKISKFHFSDFFRK